MGKKESSGDEWLTTYADAITLLMCFFVLFFSITDGMDTVKMLQIMNSLKGGMGVLDYTAVTTVFPNPAELLEDREGKWQELQEFVESQGLDNQVQVDISEDGYKITLNNSLTFESGDARLKESAKALLKKIAVTFTGGDIKSIDVLGHTDNRPISSREFKSNWDLGSARAIAVVQQLMAYSNVKPDRFTAGTPGEFQPVAPNTTAEGRNENRRVEIYVKYKIPTKLKSYDDFSNIDFN